MITSGQLWHIANEAYNLGKLPNSEDALDHIDYAHIISRVPAVDRIVQIIGVPTETCEFNQVFGLSESGAMYTWHFTYKKWVKIGESPEVKA